METRRGQPLLAAVAVALIAALAATVPAVASTPLGQTFEPSPELGCDGLSIQTGVASGTPYIVPAPGGVITSWSMLASEKQSPFKGGALEFNVFRPAGPGLYTIIGEDNEPITSPGLKTFPVHIPVDGGDIIGDYQDLSGLLCGWIGLDRAPTGDTIAGRVTPLYFMDAPLGTTLEFAEGSSFAMKLDLAATLEPDVDRDGFGDETQEGCRVDPSPCESPTKLSIWVRTTFCWVGDGPADTPCPPDGPAPQAPQGSTPPQPSTAPPALTVSPPGPRLQIAPTALVNSAGYALVSASCRGAAGTCSGTMVISTSKVHGSRVGTARYRIGAGRNATTRVRISAAARKAVRRRPLSAVVVATGNPPHHVKLKRRRR